MLIITFCSFTNSIAQNDSIKSVKSNWSIGIDFGSSTPSKNFSTGYKKSSFNLNQIQGNLRYMFNSTWGINGNLSNESFSNGSNSLDYKSSNFRIGMQSVYNISKVLKFENSKVTTFIYAGPQISFHKIKSGVNSGNKEKTYGFSLGISPQFYLSSNLVLNTSFDFIADYRKDYNWDGFVNPDYNSSITNFKIGLIYNFLNNNNIKK